MITLMILKDYYGIIYDMLSQSGFGWNDDTKTIKVDSDEVWNYDM